MWGMCHTHGLLFERRSFGSEGSAYTSTCGARRLQYEPQSKLLKGVIQGIIQRTTIGVTKGDTRSLDYSSYRPGSSDASAISLLPNI